MPHIPGIIAAAEDLVAPPGGGVLTLVSAGDPFTNNTTTDTATYPSISPPADTDVYVIFGWRAGSTLRTNNVPTAGFATTGAFTEIANEGLLADDSSYAIRAAIYKATATATPGSGTVVCTANGTLFQQAIAVYYVDNATGNLQTIEFNGTGITGSAAWSGTPSGHRASIGMIVQGGIAGSLAFDDELSAVVGSPFTIGQMMVHIGSRLGTISDPQDFSGGHSGRYKAFVAASVTGASS